MTSGRVADDHVPRTRLPSAQPATDLPLSDVLRPQLSEDPLVELVAIPAPNLTLPLPEESLEKDVKGILAHAGGRKIKRNGGNAG